MSEWRIKEYRTQYERAFIVLRDEKGVAEAYNQLDAEFIMQALREREYTNMLRTRYQV